MDAITRRYWEVEGYVDLGMWEEVQALLEDFFSDVPDQPQLLGILVTLGVSIEFIGRATHLRPTLPIKQASQ